MKTWPRRLRGTLGMGIAWAMIWAPFGLLIGVASIVLPFLPWHYFFNIWDAPLPAMAVPGFVGGILFSVALGLAHSSAGGPGLWRLTAMISGPLVLLSTASAAASLLLARKADGRRLHAG